MVEEEKKKVCKTMIERVFRKVTKTDSPYLELDNFLLIDKNRVRVTVGDEIKVGDIITTYTVDDCKPLLEVLYVKEWTVNKYPEIAEQKRVWCRCG